RYQVPLFPSQADWWFVRLGPRLAGGRCLRCKRDAGECDLRPCGQCPWAMCTQCWDLENGRCMRCHWRIPDLPESLRESGRERCDPRAYNSTTCLLMSTVSCSSRLL